MANEQDLKAARRAHVDAALAAGTRPFPNDFRAFANGFDASRDDALRLSKSEEARAALPTEEELTGNETHLHVYGRVMAKRGPFLVIRTPGGDLQSLVRPEKLSAEHTAVLAAIDLADHVAVSGPAIKTKTGAFALSARTFAHLGKAMLPPPAKWHGLTDVEKRYRERYVDLFANPEVASVFHARSVIVKALRSFLDGKDFLEVETPLLHPLRGGATAKPFDTHHNALDMHLYLRIAPELYLKRLLVGGFDRVYEIGRCFRNEGISTRHNPEFSMLEFYMAYATVEDLLDLTEAMFRFVDAELAKKHANLRENRPFELAVPWKRVAMREAIAERCERAAQGPVSDTPWKHLFDRATLNDAAKLEAACAKMAETADGLTKKLLGKARSFGERVFLLYELLVEPELTNLYRTDDDSKSLPVFILEYPFEVSPLARKNDADPRFVDRFELFIDGREVANAFSELNDPDDQADRFRAQLDGRANGDDEAMDFDADYVRALEHGMPPAAGFGLGVDRLVMTLCGQSSIRDVLLFPLLRPAADDAG